MMKGRETRAIKKFNSLPSCLAGTIELGILDTCKSASLRLPYQSGQFLTSTLCSDDIDIGR